MVGSTDLVEAFKARSWSVDEPTEKKFSFVFLGELIRGRLLFHILVKSTELSKDWT